MTRLFKSVRTWIFVYDLVAVILLGLLFWLYFRDIDKSWALRRALPDDLEGPIAGSVWFGALGGIVISFKGVYDHGADDWLNRFNLWHLGRPFSGAIAGGITFLLLQVVNKDAAPTTAVVLVAAFVLGTQEKRFFNFLYEVAGLIVRVPEDDLEGAIQVAAIEPQSGPVGVTLTISGAGFAPKASARLGGVPLDGIVVGADGKSISGSAPAGTGTVDLIVANPDGPAWVKAGAFTYTAPVPSAPVLTAINPATAVNNSGDQSVTFSGTSFTDGALANWNGSDHATTFVSNTELVVTIPGTDITTPGILQIKLVNPDGGATAELPFTIT